MGCSRTLILLRIMLINNGSRGVALAACPSLHIYYQLILEAQTTKVCFSLSQKLQTHCLHKHDLTIWDALLDWFRGLLLTKRSISRTA
jgi:hypothetical protein